MVPDLLDEALDFKARLKDMMDAPPPRHSTAMTLALWAGAAALIVIAAKLVL
jgi:hypothetical protein